MPISYSEWIKAVETAETETTSDVGLTQEEWRVKLSECGKEWSMSTTRKWLMQGATGGWIKSGPGIRRVSPLSGRNVMFSTYLLVDRPKIVLDSTSPDYPTWVCDSCCVAAGANRVITVSTYHSGTCDVCKQTRNVTEPRDWGYPTFILNG